MSHWYNCVLIKIIITSTHMGVGTGYLGISYAYTSCGPKSTILCKLSLLPASKAQANRQKPASVSYMRLAESFGRPKLVVDKQAQTKTKHSAHLLQNRRMRGQSTKADILLQVLLFALCLGARAAGVCKEREDGGNSPCTGYFVCTDNATEPNGYSCTCHHTYIPDVSPEGCEPRYQASFSVRQLMSTS